MIFFEEIADSTYTFVRNSSVPSNLLHSDRLISPQRVVAFLNSYAASKRERKKAAFALFWSKYSEHGE